MIKYFDFQRYTFVCSLYWSTGEQQTQAFHGLKIGYSLWHPLFVMVCTNFKTVENLKLIANTNHAAKMYPMHTFENITQNWIIFPPTAG